MQATETFVVGGREFTCVRMNAFAANKLFLRVQKILLPVLASLRGDQSLMEMDILQAASKLSEHLDEDMINTVLLPMFEESRVMLVENKRVIKTAADIDVCFNVETLFDMYVLAFHVLKFQLGPFFDKLINLFGNQGAIAQN